MTPAMLSNTAPTSGANTGLGQKSASRTESETGDFAKVLDESMTGDTELASGAQGNDAQVEEALTKTNTLDVAGVSLSLTGTQSINQAGLDASSEQSPLMLLVDGQSSGDGASENGPLAGLLFGADIGSVSQSAAPIADGARVVPNIISMNARGQVETHPLGQGFGPTSLGDSGQLLQASVAGQAQLAQSQGGTGQVSLTSLGVTLGSSDPGAMAQSQLLVSAEADELFSESFEQQLGRIASSLEGTADPSTGTESRTLQALNQLEGRFSNIQQSSMVGAPKLGSASFGADVAEKVLWMASQGLSEAEIQLDPPELGPLQARITVHQDQAQVVFTSQSAQVREALDQSAARLREMFAGEGLNLVDVGVSDQGRGQDDSGSSGQLANGGSSAQTGDSTQVAENSSASLPISSQYLVDQYA